MKEEKYIDFSAPVIRAEAARLFEGALTEREKAERAFLFVRDEIPHSFDCGAAVITAKASEVLLHRTGICHAKANLLAALLRSQGIPAGMCFQHLTLADDESLGYCVHCYNAVFLGGKWVKLDARGNKPGVNAQFSTDAPVLAFPNRKEYREYSWPGIYACPHKESMEMLETAKCLQDIVDHIPEFITEKPDIRE